MSLNANGLPRLVDGGYLFNVMQNITKNLPVNDHRNNLIMAIKTHYNNVKNKAKSLALNNNIVQLSNSDKLILSLGSIFENKVYKKGEDGDYEFDDNGNFIIDSYVDLLEFKSQGKINPEDLNNIRLIHEFTQSFTKYHSSFVNVQIDDNK